MRENSEATELAAHLDKARLLVLLFASSSLPSCQIRSRNGHLTALQNLRSLPRALSFRVICDFMRLCG